MRKTKYDENRFWLELARVRVIESRLYHHHSLGVGCQSTQCKFIHSDGGRQSGVTCLVNKNIMQARIQGR